MRKMVDDFLKYLSLHGISLVSLKYYKSDLVNFLTWTNDRKINNELIEKYIDEKRLITPTSTLKRRLSTLRSFANFIGIKKPIKSWQDRILLNFANRPKLHSFLDNIFFSRPNWYKTYHSYPLSNYLHIAILVIFCSLSAYALYDQVFKNTANTSAFPTALTRPNRYLSFQGRLTNNLGNPITTATDVVFKLYDAVSAGNQLWTSGTCSITPDSDGIFSALLGSSCGSEITSGVFSENASVWVGVTVGADAEATPRIQIATVAYALNAETLQGYPAGTGTSTIPYINSSGEVVIAAASPKLQSTSGTFSVEGVALTITTPNTSNGVITVNPDGTGTLNLTFEGAAAGGSVNGFVNATNANITSGSLYGGTVASAATGYNFIDFQSGVSPTSKFSVSSTGQITSATGLTIGTTSLSETTSAIDSGAYLVGVFDEFDNSSSSIIQAVLNDLDTAINTGGSGSMWTLGSGVIYPTSATNDFALGGSTLATSMFGLDESAGNFYFGYDNSANPAFNFEATDADAGEFGFNTNDSFYFSNANVGIGTTAPSARQHIISTTEQQRLGYDTSNYWSSTVSSTGGLTLAGTGTGGSLTLTPTAGQNLNISLSTTGDLAVNTNQLYVDTSLGYVGMGTTTPLTILDVAGSTGTDALTISGAGAKKFATNWSTNAINFDVFSPEPDNKMLNSGFETDLTSWTEILSYTLNDQFTTDRSAGAVNGTSAEPTGGTRTVVDTNGKLSITGGQLSLATGSVAYTRINYPTVTRSAGKILVAKVTKTAGSLAIGYGYTTSTYPEISNIYFSGSNIYFDGGSAIVGAVANSTEYLVATILRGTGHYTYIKGGAYTNWTLLWIGSTNSTSSLGLMVDGMNGTSDSFTADNIRIPTSTWLPTPLAYDTFTRSDGAIGSSETTGPDSQTTPSLAWTGGAISTNKNVITPSLGSELVTNGTFDADTNWNKGAGWTIASGVLTATSSSGQTTQAVSLGGGWSLAQYTMSNRTAGSLRISTLSLNDQYVSANGTRYFSGRLGGATTLYLTSNSLSADIDNVSVKALTLSSLFSSVSTSDADVIADANVTMTAGTQAGIVTNLDSTSSPANFIIVYHDGTSVKVDEAVAGVYTNKQTTTVTYSAGATLRAIREGTKLRVYYNNALVGAELTMTANTNTKHGLFSTYSGNSFDNFTLWPRGSGTTKFTDAPFEELTATRDTGTKYAGTASAKLVAGGVDGNYLQSVNVGDTATYTLIAYAYTTGAAVTSADVELYYDTAVLSTTYTDMTGGWYRLTGALTGVASAKNFGVRVKAGKTAYVDSMSLAAGNGVTTNLSIANSSTGVSTMSVESTTTLNSGLAASQALIVKGASAQTANLQEWQNSSGTVLSAIDASGKIGIGDSTPDALFDIDSSSTTGGDFLITNTGVGLSGTVAGITSNSTTTGDILTISSTGLTTGTALTLSGPSSTGVTDHFVKLTSDIGSASSILNLNPDFSGNAITGYGVYNLATDTTANANTDYGYYGSLTLTGNAAKTGVGLYSTVTSSSTTGDTLIGLDLASTVTGIIDGATTRSVYGIRNQPTAGAESTSGNTNVYGEYIKTSADVGVGGTVNGYGLYIANGTFDTDGTSTNIGLYVESPTGADTNYAAIFDGGNVGIGMTNPSVSLDITGDIEYTGTITDVSDARLKENFSQITNPLDKITNLIAYRFNMIGKNPKEIELGYKAQEMQDILPELVKITDPENGYLGINYIGLIPVITEAIKEINNKILALSESFTTNIIKTEIISPITNSDLIIDLQPDNNEEASKLVIKGENDEEVISFDASGDATISGTLYADDIESEKLKKIEELLHEVEANQSLLAESQSWETNTSTDSAELATYYELHTTNFFVTGQAAMTSLFVSDDITSKNINSLDSPLSLQPLAINPIEIMAGKIIIDTDGNAIFLGNVKIAGNLTINNLAIANSPTSEVSSGEINTNAIAGKATLSANLEELKIVNSKLKIDSFVYITPLSNTKNQVLYVKSKDQGFFSVGFSEPLDIDVEFNWWIIELEK